MIDIYNAQQELLGQLERKEIPGWASNKECVVSEKLDDAIIVYDQKYHIIVEAVATRQIDVFRSLRMPATLCETLQSKIDSGGRVIFYPNRKYLREFFNLKGFIHKMQQVFASLNNAEVILPAGQYQGKWLFGVATRKD